MTSEAMEDSETVPGHDGTVLRCGAKTRAGGKCLQPKGWGTDHQGAGPCKLHGGRTASVMVGAAREAAEREARSALSRLGAPVPVVNAPRRLMDLAGEVDQWLSVCREAVMQLEVLVTTDGFGSEVAKAMVLLYTAALERAHRVLVDLARLDLDARSVRLEELQLGRVAEVVERVVRRQLGVEAGDLLLGEIGAEFRKLQ